MATVIDALLVTLGLDVSGFKKGQAEANEALAKTKDTTIKNAKEIEAKAKVAADSFKSMRREILGLVTAFASVGAIKGFVQNVVTGDAALGRLAETTGMSVEKLKAWQDLAKQLGGSSGDIDAAVRHINTLKEAFNRGDSNDGVMNMLGQLLSPDDFATFWNRATKTGEALEILQRAVVNLGKSGNSGKAMNLMQQAGFTEGTVVVMRQMGDNAAGMLEAQIKLNKATHDGADAAQKLEQAWNKVAQAIENAGRQLLQGPMLWVTEKLLVLVDKIGKYTSGPGKIIDDAAGGIFKPEVNKWLKENIGDKLPGGGGEFTTKNLVGRGLDGAWQWFLDYGTPANKKARGSGASGPTSSRGAAGNAWSGASEVQEAEADLRGWAWAQASRPGAAAKLARAAQRAKDGGSQNSARTDVSIGTLQVITQATDAPGIARDIGGALRANYSLAGEANYGTE